MAKTKAQVEKQKRDTEKRKKLERTILKLAAAMPDEAPKETAPSPVSEPNARKKP